MNRTLLIFDVDGTLTAARGKISGQMSQILSELVRRDDIVVALATGSDKDKIIEQIGCVFNDVDFAFTCSGNELYTHGIKRNDYLYATDWEPSQQLVDRLQQMIDSSSYPERHGNHIEYRSGTVNVSICGRNATERQRQKYFKWEQAAAERQQFVDDLHKEFPEITANVGGQISIDIFEKGRDKGIVAKYFENHDFDIKFFGDKMKGNGNDVSLMEALKKQGHQSYCVDGPEDTIKTLVQLNIIGEQDER